MAGSWPRFRLHQAARQGVIVVDFGSAIASRYVTFFAPESKAVYHRTGRARPAPQINGNGDGCFSVLLDVCSSPANRARGTFFFRCRFYDFSAWKRGNVGWTGGRDATHPVGHRGTRNFDQTLSFSGGGQNRNVFLSIVLRYSSASSNRKCTRLM